MSDYVTIREHLGSFIGRKIVEITQQDEEEYRQTGKAYVMLMFDDGSTLTFSLTEATVTTEEPG